MRPIHAWRTVIKNFKKIMINKLAWACPVSVNCKNFRFLVAFSETF